MRITAKDFITGTPNDYFIEAGVISRIQAVDSKSADALPWIAPGLFDVQINGFGGVDFNNPITKQEWDQACHVLARHGCTHFLATLITNSPENYRTLLSGMNKLSCVDAESPCRGYHMEGPFFNPDPGTRGIHNPEWMHAPDLKLAEEWQEASGKHIRLITLAPEIDLSQSLPFIGKMASLGIRVAAGHSLAKGETLSQAIRAGVTCWTHLGNAVGRSQDKFNNPIFHVLGGEIPHATLIPDSTHIPPYAFRSMVAALRDRLLLTTDAISAAGAPMGKYRICQHEITIEADQIARTEEGRLAGSTLTPFDGVFKAAEMCGKPWQIFWEAFSTRPARWMGLRHGLEEGLEASFCLLQSEPQPRLKSTWLKGHCVYNAE